MARTGSASTSRAARTQGARDRARLRPVRFAYSRKLADELARGEWVHDPQCVLVLALCVLSFLGAAALACYALGVVGAEGIARALEPGGGDGAGATGLFALIGCATLVVMGFVFVAAFFRCQALPAGLAYRTGLAIAYPWLVFTFDYDEATEGDDGIGPEPCEDGGPRPVAGGAAGGSQTEAARPARFEATVAYLPECTFRERGKKRVVVIEAKRRGAIRGYRFGSVQRMPADELLEALVDGRDARAFLDAPDGLRADAVRDSLEFWPVFKPGAAARLDALGVERAER